MVIKTLFDLEKVQGVLQSASDILLMYNTHMHTNTKEYYRVQSEIPFVYIHTHTHTLAHKKQGVLQGGI